MPFTVSHAAVVLPLLCWKHLDPLALVIGSMAPDFGYFLQHFHLASQAHTIRGSVTIALPLACLAWVVVRCLAAVLSAPLPEPDRGVVRNFLSSPPFRIRSVGWILLSLLLGIWSHTILDSFTHVSGWSVNHVELLHSPWPVYKALQHAGSLLGMAVLLGVYFRWRHRHEVAFQWQREHTMLAILVALAAATALPPAWSHALRFDGPMMVKALVFRLIVNSIAIFCVAYFSLGLFLQLRKTRKLPE